MKKLVLVTLALICAQVAFAAENVNSGQNNNTIIVKPTINIKGCCTGSCAKPKTIVKKVVVEKIVEKQVIVEKPVEKIVYVDHTIIETRIVKKERKKNRISLLGGVGPTHLSQPNASQVNLDRSAVGGVMYQRSVSESWSLGIQGQTNQTLLGVVGFDF